MMKSAIVGCGSIAVVHAVCLLQIEGCELVGFADIKKERAEAFADEYGGRAYDSFEEMLEVERPDVLHICTPHYLHVPMSVYALSQGVHVFMEKPPAITFEQLKQLRQAVENSNKQLGICFQNRYNSSVQYVKKMLETEAGKILGGRGVVTWRRDAPYYTESDWRGTWAKEGGGVLINQSIHTLDLLVYLFGRPVWTDARMSNHHLSGVIEVEDTMEALIKFTGNGTADSGSLKPMVNFYATTGYCEDKPPFIEIVCENMTLRIEESEVVCYRDGQSERSEHKNEMRPVGKTCWGSGHNGCIRTFYQALEKGEDFEESLDGILDTAKLMLSMYESAKNEKPVTIRQDGSK